MIYDALLKELTADFIGSVSISDVVIRTRVKVKEFDFVFEQHKEQKSVHLISVRDNCEDVPENEKSYYSTGFDNFPEDCVTELAYVLRVLGVSEFIWGEQLHRVNIFTNNNPDYIYSTEYVKSLNRRMVIANPVSGDVFIRNADEVSYDVVPRETWSPVYEQAKRLMTAACIPDTWLTRVLTDNTEGFVYTKMKETFVVPKI